MTWGYGYAKRGETAWCRLSDVEAGRTNFNWPYFASARAKGLNTFGLTWITESWQNGGTVGDLYPLALQLDLASQFGYVVLRFQPWALYGHLLMDDPTRLNEPLLALAKMLSGRNLQRVALSLFAEPAMLSELDVKGIPYPLSPAQWLKQYPICWRAIDEFYAQIIPAIRAVNEDLTLVLSPPGWAHLKERGDGSEMKYENTIRSYDVYSDGVGIETQIQGVYDYHRLRGEKMIVMETGPPEGLLGTPEGEKIVSRIFTKCSALRIPCCRWAQAY